MSVDETHVPARETILLHTDTLRLLLKLPMEQRGEVITAVLAYVAYQTPPKLEDCADIVFSAICVQLDREYAAYLDRCDKRQAAAIKRWAVDKYGEKWQEYYDLRLAELRRKDPHNYLRRGRNAIVDAAQFAIPLDPPEPDSAQ